MRKFIVSTLAVVAFATVAVAQESVLVFDVRNNTTGPNNSLNQSIVTPFLPFANGQVNQGPPAGTGPQGPCNAGRLGDGQILRIMPTITSTTASTGNRWPNWDGDADQATGNLQAWLLVNNDAGDCAGDVISSLGIDIMTTSPATPRNVIGNMSWAWSAAVAWNGTAVGAYSGGNNGNVTGIKAVDVPVNATPTYDTTGGATFPANAGAENVGAPVNAYRVGTLTVTGGARNCSFGGAPGNATGSTYQLRFRVNNLLITRTCSNANPTLPDEQIAFGYGDPSGASMCGASPELPAVNGSSSLAMSTAPDAIVQVLMKADFNGSGSVTGADDGFYYQAQADSLGGVIHQRELYLGELNGNTAATITGADDGFYYGAQTTSATCP